MVSYAARASSDALEVISWLLPLQSRCHVTFNRAWRQYFPFETSMVIALVSGQETFDPKSHRFLFSFVDVFVIFPPKTYVIFSVVCLLTVFACFCSVKNFAIRAFWDYFFLRCCLLHKGNHLYNTIKEHCALQKRFYGDFSLSIAWSHNVTPGKMSNFNYCIHGVVFFWEIQCRIFMALDIETMIRVRHLHNYLYVKKYLELI